MFGGISAAGPHHLVFATFEGSVVWFDVDAGAVVNYCAIYPGGPEHVHCSAALAGTDGGVWVCDVNHRRVREIAPDGWQRLVVGGLPTPGVDHQDDPGVLWEPCALALFAGDLVVGNGGFDMEHGVQRFSPDDGTYRGGLERDEGWKRAQGLAVVGDELWVAESEADRVCRYAASGQCLDVARPHPDFRRPFRLEAWPDGGALLVMAPEDENDLDKCGVALLDGEATFTRWFLRAGEGHGEVTCPYDLAVLPDGRVAVLDLPLGQPPDVRLRIFRQDGVLQRTLLDETAALSEALATYFRSVLDSAADTADTLHRQARIRHFHAGGTADQLARAADLYRAAIARDPGRIAAHVGLATVLQHGLDDPASAEAAYEAALAAGAPRGLIQPRMAECRRARGDLDAAIRLLQEAVETPPLPENYHARVEELANYFLERAESAGD